MTDVFSKKQRSRIMAAVRSTGNRDTEDILVTIFRRNGITGWRRHLPLIGKPDFTFRERGVVVFVDGCFWHGCSLHLRMPATNRGYWLKKIARNKARDKVVTRKLRSSGWLVLRLWEHELKDETRVLRLVMKQFDFVRKSSELKGTDHANRAR